MRSTGKLTPANPVLRWTRILHSRPPAPTAFEDQGTFTVLSETDVRETGKMYNPKAGIDESYEEMWRRYRVPSSSAWCVLERVDGVYATDGCDEQKRAHELPRAFLARLGSWALGLARTEAGFVAYRDELDSQSEWARKYDFGDAGASLPAMPVDQPQWKKGEVVKLGDGEWRVHTAGRL